MAIMLGGFFFFLFSFGLSVPGNKKQRFQRKNIKSCVNNLIAILDYTDNSCKNYQYRRWTKANLKEEKEPSFHLLQTRNVIPMMIIQTSHRLQKSAV